MYPEFCGIVVLFEIPEYDKNSIVNSFLGGVDNTVYSTRFFDLGNILVGYEKQ